MRGLWCADFFFADILGEITWVQAVLGVLGPLDFVIPKSPKIIIHVHGACKRWQVRSSQQFLKFSKKNPGFGSILGTTSCLQIHVHADFPCSNL